MAQWNCGKMCKSRTPSDKTRANCAEMFLDTIQQKSYITPPPYSNPWQLIKWSGRKQKNSLFIHVNCQSIHTFISPHEEDDKKKSKFSSLVLTQVKSKDGFDIDEISLNKRFFPETVIQAGNIKRHLIISIVYYSQTQTLV